ncbi:MAG: PfkB family carbohydrate kinase [Thermodesulfobacteriota bacterium]|nr:MAG: PfkB family carbohydrate kinase [Thermodesulfobacteriota bacterium]
MKVIGLGQCSLDYITLLDGFPPEDAKKEVLDFTVQGGGPVATALVTLSRLGVKTAMIGRVSDDPAGDEIRRGLKAEGVDVKGLLTKPGGRSQQAVVMVNKKAGTRTICWQRPTVEPLSEREVDPAFFKGAGFLLLDGLMTEASYKAAERAVRLGIPVMLDAGSMRPGMLKLASMCDYVVSSDRFVSDLKLSIKEAFKKLSTGRTKAITVTVGDKGSFTFSEGKVYLQKAFKVKAVDTTGAGDVFHGAYAYGVIQGWDIRKTVEFASAVSAMKCRELGGRAGIPTLTEAQRFIKESK